LAVDIQLSLMHTAGTLHGKLVWNHTVPVVAVFHKFNNAYHQPVFLISKWTVFT